MKVGRDYSWWVSYTWEYEYIDPETKEKETICDHDTQRFYSKKKDIKKTVTDYIENNELSDIQYTNLNVTINECYMTTPEEI